MRTTGNVQITGVGPLAIAVIVAVMLSAFGYAKYEDFQDDRAIDKARTSLLLAGNLNPAAIAQVRRDLKMLHDQSVYSRAEARKIATGF